MSILRKGSSGEEVQQLQRNLNALGNTLEVTGVFDDPTQSALVRFQHATFKGTTHPIDGVYSVQTATAITTALRVAKRNADRAERAKATGDHKAAPADKVPEAAETPMVAPAVAEARESHSAEPPAVETVHEPETTG